MIFTTTTDRVNGVNGGYLVTRGKPRYALLEGKHYVVGRGKAHECGSIAEAYGLRDELLRNEGTFGPKRAGARR